MILNYSVTQRKNLISYKVQVLRYDGSVAVLSVMKLSIETFLVAKT